MPRGYPGANPRAKQSNRVWGLGMPQIPQVGALPWDDYLPSDWYYSLTFSILEITLKLLRSYLGLLPRVFGASPNPKPHLTVLPWGLPQGIPGAL